MTGRTISPVTTAPDGAPLLDVDHLSVTYATGGGDVAAVRDVSFRVAKGEVVGIAGESGCGKSTLASTILRLQPAGARVSGRVLVNGQDVLTIGWGALRVLRWSQAAIVFQGASHSLNPVLRVGQQIAEAIVTHRRSAESAADRRVAEVLEQVGLPQARASAYPHQLSGGQRQRVMIAMALACEPELIVADEPTTALDVMVQAQILDVLRGLVTRLGVGMLFISHDLSVLSALCDRIAVMYAGRVVEVGPADEVFGAPLHPYAAALAAAFPRIGDPGARFAPAGLPGDPPDPADLPAGCAFSPRCMRVIDRCHAEDPELLPAGPPALAGEGRMAACLRVARP
ncbi:MAG: ABC transporter ATP-binding protein [Nocardioides sp.]